MHLAEPAVSSPRAEVRRIAAWSGAFTLHVAALGVLLAPIARPLLEPRPAPTDEPLWMVFEPEPPVVVPVIQHPRPEIEAVRRPPVRPRAEPTPIELARPEFLPTTLPARELAPVEPPSTIADLAPGESMPIEGARLRTRVAPPPHYPSLALRRKLEGTVTLRVLVAADGRASEVTIERSSGHRVLDEAARRRVLDHWRFEPATRNGIPVPAIGLLPIQFTINAG